MQGSTSVMPSNHIVVFHKVTLSLIEDLAEQMLDQFFLSIFCNPDLLLWTFYLQNLPQNLKQFVLGELQAVK